MAELNPLAAGQVRQPRGAVKLNGQLVDGWQTIEVENNVFRSADTFRVTLITSRLPAAFGPVWFGEQKTITVELFATTSATGTYAPAAADRLIYGQVDGIEFEPSEGTIALTGRDLTARLIDTKTSENHQNQTSSQVATLLAQREGLKPAVTATSTRIGQFYAIDHTDINAEESEWDLLVKLANFEGFDVFVTGDELHFQPKPTDGGDRYTLTWTPPDGDDAHPDANLIELQLSRDLTISKGVAVEVRSWNAKQKKAFTASWPRQVKGAKPGQSAATATTYHYSIAGLTQDQAYQRAEQLYNQIVQHMVKLEATLPGDNVLDCTAVMQLRGTGTAWDQASYPDSVKRSLSAREGYRMTVSAKNISQDIEAS